MKRNVLVLILLGLLLALVSCSPDVEVPRPTDTYDISISRSIQNGQIQVSHTKAKPQTLVSVYVNPDPGYVLKPNSLRRVDNQANKIPFSGQTNPYEFNMASYSVTIEAEFIDLAEAAQIDATDPKRNYTAVKTVSIDRNVRNAILYAVPLYGYPPNVEIPRDPASGTGTPNDPNPSGSLITINGVPDPGYLVNEIRVNGVLRPEKSLPFSFRIGTEDVTVSATFTRDVTGEALLEAGRNALNTGGYNQAAAYYELAYQSLPNNTEAIFYSTLASLGNILLTPEVRSILSSFGMARVPSSFDDWVCDPDFWRLLETEDDRDNKRWYAEHIIHSDDPYDFYYDPDEPYTENKYLPRLTTPQGFPGGFLNYDVVHNGSDDDHNPFRTYFDQLLFWNIIANNPDGFNNRIDDILYRVFGTDFDAAQTRANKLSYDDKVLLNTQLKKRLNLEEFFGSGDTYVGKAELDIIFAYLNAIKAMFEYLSAYNWDMELQVWRFAGIGAKETISTIIDKLLGESETGGAYENIWLDSARFAKILPFRNNLLTVRNASKMTTAKNSLSAALNMAKASLDKYFEWADGSSDRLSSEAKNNLNTKYKWIQAGLNSAKTTLDSNGTFYFPKKLPKPEDNRTTWYTEAQADFGVNWGGFFTSGKFTLSNLFTMDGPSTPAFYKIKWAWSTDGNYNIIPVVPVVAQQMTNASQFDTSGTTYGEDANMLSMFTWQVNTGNLKTIFPKYPRSTTQGNTAYFHEVFESIPLWPGQPTFLNASMWSGQTNSDIAKKLYDQYKR